MNISLFTKWQKDGIISEASLERVRSHEQSPLLSVHWEIKTLLYLGVLLLSTGLGVLVYKNIDTIGHQAILLFIGSVCTGSFYYCFKKNYPFSLGKVDSPNAVLDYLLLLGCLTFITFLAYVQFQYSVFGNRYGLATFIPMLVLFFTAYYFDNIGILSIAITNLAAWLGITVTPLEILKQNDFNSSTIIITGSLLGSLLIIAGIFSKRENIKRHFEFTYVNLGMHILFISLLAGIFHFDFYLAWLVLVLGTAFYFYRKALQDRSFYFVLISTLYAFIAISYFIIDMLDRSGLSLTAAYIAVLYFIGSAIALIMFLISTNKKIKPYDSI
ncbi:MAG: DUF2157 domain-containing protein [Ferruginibacter sp.]